MTKSRPERLEQRTRKNWKPVPLQIDMSTSPDCVACLRACPRQFGAIFNHGPDVVIIPELCSGCEKCLPPCPVNCIVPDPDWTPAPDEWWATQAKDDPYV